MGYLCWYLKCPGLPFVSDLPESRPNTIWPTWLRNLIHFVIHISYWYWYSLEHPRLTGWWRNWISCYGSIFIIMDTLLWIFCRSNCGYRQNDSVMNSMSYVPTVLALALHVQCSISLEYTCSSFPSQLRTIFLPNSFWKFQFFALSRCSLNFEILSVKPFLF